VQASSIGRAPGGKSPCTHPARSFACPLSFGEMAEWLKAQLC
jgi:hypothetical protein